MLKRSALTVCLLGALIGARADAGIWDRMLTSPEEESNKEVYDAKMLEGDTATLTATIQSASVTNSLDSIKRAVAAYHAAAAKQPREAEPYFRIGNLLYQMHFDCDSPILARLPTCNRAYATPRQMEQAIEAWEEFENRAPLDPRVAEILIKRAILSTKLITGSAGDRRHLESAARDYKAALDRSDGLAASRADEQVLGNLAETYMMLDRLDDSIATYLQAISVGAARVSTVYGFAVALDRDGSGDQAMRRIRSQGAGGFDAFNKEYTGGSVFFVPAGESNYYFALANEAFGNYGAALQLWNAFIASGAHREFQPRAREHIDELLKKHVRAEPVLPPELDDPN
jgi:tetratricopeptide (TPR) repeat protein